MNDHKRALLEAWWANVPDPEHPVSVPSARVLGGRTVVRKVRRLLERDLMLARRELEWVEQRDDGRRWWRLYIEGPSDDGLLASLRQNVSIRPGESPADYLLRLRRVEDALRARLGSYLEAPRRSP